MKILHPGLWEYEVEALIEYVFKKRNSFDWAFPSIVASGPNATTLHYQKSQRQIQDGELLLMDIGAESIITLLTLPEPFPLTEHSLQSRLPSTSWC